MAHPTWTARNPSYVAIFTASVGGLLEMYDFIIYAFLAPTIYRLFFSAAGEQLGLILTFATFAMGYLVRPIGGIIFGHLGDKMGRRSGLLITILLMGGATFLIGCLPTYQQIGIAAPLLLLALRILQGIAVGGDLPGGMTYLSEEASEHRCGRYMGYLFAAINCGSLLASCVVFCLHHSLSVTAFLTWGWRCAFWGSLVLTTLGLFHRRKLAESPVFQRLQQQERLQRVPVVYLLKANRPQLLRAILLLLPFMLIVSQVFVYTPTYLNRFFGVPYNTALQLNTLGIVCFVFALGSLGWISDRIGPRRMLLLIIPTMLLGACGYYELIQLQHWVIATIAFSVCCGVCSVGLLHPFVLLFCPSIRYTGIAVAYNSVFALGGLLPLILTSTIPLGHHASTVPSLFFLAAAIALCAHVALSSRRKKITESNIKPPAPLQIN